MIFLLVALLSLTGTVGGEPAVPFPGMLKPKVDPEGAQLPAYRIRKHDNPEGDQIHGTFGAFGSASDFSPLPLHVPRKTAAAVPK